jgi:hypothetical protein
MDSAHASLIAADNVQFALPPLQAAGQGERYSLDLS